MTTVNNLKSEYRLNPLGIDVKTPRLSWQMASDRRGARQTAYQVQAAAEPGATPFWDTGKVAGGQSVHVNYGGPALASGQRVYWRVRIWDETDTATEWSAPAWWEMGLLQHSDWVAQWITPDWDEDVTQSQPQPVLRKAFTLTGPVKSARVYATGLGLYELHLNGQRMGEGVLAPGWTSYDTRLQYQTYDVTAQLNSGENAIGALLGDGWYRGFIGFSGNRNTYGDRLALLLQLVVTYADGSTAVVISDSGWQTTTGPVRMSDIYNGEIYDARAELAGWNKSGYDAVNWLGVRILEQTNDILVAQNGPAIIRNEEIKPKAIITTPAGETVVDFGQNMVGWVRLQVSGPAGTTITMCHAEVLDQKGNFYITNLRAAKQLAQYTMKGDGVEIWEPRFTFMGFQYVKVEGFPGELTLDSLTGVVVHSDIPSTGSFECSNPMINQLQHNIVWGQKGNFVDVPTDCPQRDERLGWTGDAQVFIRTAAYNRDVAGFFTKWLLDLADEQKAKNGSVPMVIPDPMGRPRKSAGPGFPSGGSSAWADAAVICPWTIYLCYGDTGILVQQYDSMKSWVEYMRREAGDTYLWTTGFHFGDWLDYRGRGEMDAAPVTDKSLIASAFFAYSTSLLQQAAVVLDKTADAADYAALLGKVKAAFTDEFVTANGRVSSSSQTSYVLALHFDLLPESMRPKAAERLAASVRDFGYHLTTGFVGTPYLCHVLSRFGHTDLAYELLNQESFPSWLYPVKMGATTIWERWDGIKPDGSFQDAGMNSFNHYSYGAIGDWMYRVAAGIDTAPDGAGYRHILIQPQPGGGLTSVRAALQTVYGEVVSAWQLSDSGLHLQVTVPPNTWATVRIPVDPAQEATSVVTEGGTVITGTITDGALVVEIGAGQYSFISSGMTTARAMAKVRHVAGRLDIGSNLSDVLENKRARAIVAGYVGEGVLMSPMLRWIGNQPVDVVARLAPHLMTPEKVASLAQDLINL